MRVLRLAEYRCRETVSILRALLSLAMSGKLRGLAIFYRREDGQEDSVLTGYYKARPNSAAEATLRASIRLMRANGELDP